MNPQTEAVQKRLIALGFNPGTPDGIWGPNTRRAWNAWQVSAGLATTSTMLAKDVAKLLGVAAAPEQSIPWVDEALRLMGLREGVGKVNNPVIMDWADDLDVHYTGDDVPWCGLFVAHTMRTALPDEPLPSNILGARQYSKFGVKVNPQVGAVGVFWRGSPSGWQGHVGYLVGETANAYVVLGGNQSDSVSYTNIAKNRLLGAYWPSTGPAVFNIKLPPKPTGRLSTNEA